MEMNVVLCTDSSTFLGVELVIYSAMYHNPDVVFHWHILTMERSITHADGSRRNFTLFSDFQIEWLTFLVQFMKKGSTLVVRDCTKEYEAELAGCDNEIHAFAPHIGLRLMMEKLLPDLDRCLCFDTDMLIQGDLKHLYSGYLDGKHDLAGYTVPNERNNGYGELNAGTLMYDLAYIRKSGSLERARYYYKNAYYEFPEQGVLQDTCSVVPLPEFYNYFVGDHKKAIFKPIILHFTYGNNAVKIYHTTKADFYRYYPEHKYIETGLNMVNQVFESMRADKFRRDQQKNKNR